MLEQEVEFLVTTKCFVMGNNVQVRGAAVKRKTPRLLMFDDLLIMIHNKYGAFCAHAVRHNHNMIRARVKLFYFCFSFSVFGSPFYLGFGVVDDGGMKNDRTRPVFMYLPYIRKRKGRVPT